VSSRGRGLPSIRSGAQECRDPNGPWLRGGSAITPPGILHAPVRHVVRTPRVRRRDRGAARPGHLLLAQGTINPGQASPRKLAVRPFPDGAARPPSWSRSTRPDHTRLPGTGAEGLSRPQSGGGAPRSGRSGPSATPLIGPVSPPTDAGEARFRSFGGSPGPFQVITPAHRRAGRSTPTDFPPNGRRNRIAACSAGRAVDGASRSEPRSARRASSGSAAGCGDFVRGPRREGAAGTGPGVPRLDRREEATDGATRPEHTGEIVNLNRTILSPAPAPP